MADPRRRQTASAETGGRVAERRNYSGGGRLWKEAKGSNFGSGLGGRLCSDVCSDPFKEKGY